MGKKTEEAFLREYARAFGSKQRAEKAIETIKEKTDENTLGKSLETAAMVLELRSSEDSVLAGLLSLMAEKGIGAAEPEKSFGKKVAETISEKAALKKALLFKPHSPENSRKKLLVVLSTNPGVVLIQLAEVVVELRHLDETPKELRETFLNEARLVYAPLAHQIGFYNIHSQLNDLAFKHLEPRKYAEMENLINARLKGMEDDIQHIKKTLQEKLGKAGVKADVSGRLKSIYSTYLKMQRKKTGINGIYDLIALRVVTETERDCYEALGIVHTLWKPILGEFDDYIAKPKPNGYKSLHTALISENNNTVEVQIRTREMHDLTEYGLASHAQYKGEPRYGKKIDWIKQVLEWQKQTGETAQADIFGKEIFVLTPKGEVVELAEGATALDFAYAVHSEVGNKCKSITINGKIAPLNTPLNTGDVIVVTTSQKQEPKMSWLNFVTTPKAKQKIRTKLQLDQKLTRRKTGIDSIKTSHQKIKLAKCCSPLPGDEIIGLKTTKRKISVHRIDCPQLEKQEGKTIRVDWHDKPGYYSTAVMVKATDRIGLLKDLLAAFSRAQANVLSTNARALSGNNVVCTFEIKLKDLKQFEQISGLLRQVKGVVSVER